MPSDRRILLVLADRADRALASLVLRQAFPDYAIEEIGDAVAFAEALVAAAPTAVVVAARLAWADGLQLLAALRRHHPQAFLVLFDEGLGRVFSSRLPDLDVDRQVERSSAGFLQLPRVIRAGLARATAPPAGGPGPADAVDRQLVAEAPVGLFAATVDGTLTRVNPALARLLDRAPGQGLVGERLQDLLADAEPAIPWETLRSAGARPELVVRLPTGAGPRRLRVVIWPVLGAAGQLERLDGMVQELPAAATEVRPAVAGEGGGADEAQAAPAAAAGEGVGADEAQPAPAAVAGEGGGADEAQPAPAAATGGGGGADEALDQLTYAVSHDLQEPLHVIARHAQLLLERHGERLDSEATRSLGHLVGSAERMQAMIDGLLECARAGRDQTPFEPVDFGQALEEALANLHATIEEAGAEVRHTLLPTLWADHRQIVQLFQNLVGNAVKFRGSDPVRVVVGAKERDNDWRFAVKDNGIGIDPRFHDRIFGMFQRLHTAEEYPGTGVGLALCRRIVEHHGGSIWVHSAPGEGATFFFTIPKRARLPAPETPA